MNWLTGSSKQAEIKNLIALLADPARRDSAAWELIHRGEESVAPLIAALASAEAGLIPYYEQILARIPAATPQLIQQLKTAHPIMRARAAETFFFSGDKAAMPALLDALKGEYFTVRARSAMALANMGDPRVVPHLLPLLKDRECEVRRYACAALAKFRDPSTFDEIANVLLDDPKIEARQAAARAFAEMKNPAALPYLMEALRASFWWYERDNAIEDLLAAIESVGKEAAPLLIEALTDKEANVRKYAATLLGRLKEPEAVEELGVALYDLHSEVGKAAAEALAELGAAAVDYFVEALRHPEPDVRENAACALGKIDDPRVPALLIGALSDAERNVCKQALISLGRFRAPAALLALKEVAANRADREMSQLAKKLLAAMG